MADFFGTAGNDRLTGGAGRDRLFGERGNDTLNGAAGDDTLYGGLGNDSYRFTGASGRDQVALDPGGSDRVVLGAGIGPDQVRLVRLVNAGTVGDDLSIEIDDGRGSRITLWDHFAAGGASVERLGFADGSAWDLTGGLVFTGDDFANQLRGSVHDDTMDGAGGDDALFGGTGDDSYRFQGAFGSDAVGRDAGGSDRVLLDPDLAEGEVRLVRLADRGSVGADLLIVVEGEESRGTIRLRGHFDGDAPTVERLALGSGRVIDLTRGLAITGDEGSNQLQGTAFGDTLTGAGGDDLLYGGAGNDLYRFEGDFGRDQVAQDEAGSLDRVAFGVGVDPLDLRLVRPGVVGDLGNDLLIRIDGGDGNEVNLWDHFATGGPYIEKLQLDNGSLLDLRRGLSLRGDGSDEALAGSARADTLDGGRGDDHLAGGAGRDVYVFARGWGSDTLDDRQGVSTILLDGLDAADIVSTRLGADLLLTRRGSADRLLIEDYSATLHRLDFADLGLGRAFMGNEGNDLLVGTDRSEHVRGNGGADTLRGDGGADRLWGGAGADRFQYLAARDSRPGTPDRIMDFESGRDRIDLRQVDADTGSAGDQPFRFIGGSAFSGEAGELRYRYDAATRLGRLEGDPTGDGIPDLVVTFLHLPTLDAGDLLL